MNRYIDVDKLKKLIDEKWKELADKNVKVGGGKWDAEISTYLSVLRLIDTLQLQQEQPKRRLIQVKCIHPYDESWEKDKIYTCEVWHHGDLNRNFWDVYYDYGKDPKYVQFPTIELLNEEFAIVKQELPSDLEVSKFCQPVPKNIADCVAEHYWEMLGEEGKEDTKAIEASSHQEQEADLEKELEEYFSGWADSPDYGQVLNSDGECVSTDEVIALARHFAEWGAIHLNARKEE